MVQSEKGKEDWKTMIKTKTTSMRKKKFQKAGNKRSLAATVVFVPSTRAGNM